MMLLTATTPQTNSVSQAILARRNVRHFKPEATLSPEILSHLLELTMAAPSSWNLQDWKVVLVQSDEQKQALSQAAWGQPQIVQAPLNAVFIADADGAWRPEVDEIYEIALRNDAWNADRIAYLKESMPAFQQQLKDNGLAREYAVKDAMIAATHMTLAAQGLGLNVCIMNGWIEAQVKQVIGISDRPELAVALVLAIGYASDVPANPGRLPMEKRIFTENLQTPFSS